MLPHCTHSAPTPALTLAPEPFLRVSWGQLAMFMIFVRVEKRVWAAEHLGEVYLQFVLGHGGAESYVYVHYPLPKGDHEVDHRFGGQVASPKVYA